MIVLDTSAWVEYFIGSDRGRKVESFIKEDGALATPMIVLVELACKSARENIDFSSQIGFIRANSAILGFDEEMVIPIAETYASLKARNRKLSLADAIILSTAKSRSALLVTCDSDFSGAGNVEIVR
ncbi:PIN domain-containing protein [Candidatus Woesearchaeota archaeon]|nr:PIN domain-containing protein [Candidatus Woesearchaeota archaeon]